MSIYDVNGNRIIKTFPAAQKNTQIHFNVAINPTHPVNEWVDSAGSLSVNTVLILPSTYTPDGEPTRMIFMHHGTSGTVTDTGWYESVQHWDDFYGAYLDAGFAVFDINGSGPYSASDDTYHIDYGCPNAVSAAYAAYEYIINNYNIDRRIYVHGSSMGGSIGIAFPKAFPGIVRAVGLFAPAELRAAAVSTYANSNQVAVNFGYTNQSAAESDGFNEYKCAALEIEHYDSSGARKFHDFLYDWENATGETHVARFPVPIKFWHGTSDATVSYKFSQKAVDAIRLGGGMAYYRPISGGGHDICTGSNSTVIAEAVLWFKRF